MNTKQPKTLKLAEWLDHYGSVQTAHQAAAELRRLHDECEMKENAYQAACLEIRKLEKLNTELVGTLEKISLALGSDRMGSGEPTFMKDVRAALAKAKEQS